MMHQPPAGMYPAEGRRFTGRVYVLTSDVTVSGGWSNGVLARVFAAEAPLVRRLRLPFGLTAIVLAQKPR